MTTDEFVNYMKQAFVAYSNGQAVVPPVGELIFTDPKGEAHIKYGYIKGGDAYCIKIASGFYDNPKLGIASSQGMMLLFNQQTGQPQAVLLDEGWLTDIRTAAAGALAAKYFAPKRVDAIGIIGTGTQAKLQLRFLKAMTPCRKVWVWGRNRENAQKYQAELAGAFEVQIAENPAEIARHCNLIVTTTPSEKPLLQAKDIRAGTHITAMGSDTAYKQELESGLLKKADLVVSDSIPQSKSRGEIYRAVKDGMITVYEVVELGNAIQNISLQRTNDQQISVVDLTGVAVQDIMIANAVYAKFIAFENQSS
jgi:ornithine cyclodeaminase